ncbi:restriction endonuclease subunit S [Streptococcus sp. 10F2]
MTRMKDSGIEWIGEVPEEWGVTKLKYICGMQSGNNLTSLEISSENDGGKIFPVYGGNGQRGYYSDFTNEGNYCLVGRQGALAGNVHFVSGKFWATDHAIVVYEHTHTYSKYLCYLLKAMNLNQYAFETSAQPGVSVEKILQLETIHCPKGEQTQIADFLDKKVAQMDKVKSLLEEQIKTLEDYRQSLIYETVTKGLDKTAPLKEVDNKWISVIPSDWEERKLRYLAQTRNEKILTENSDSYVGLENITPRTGLYIETESEVDLTENISFKQGDILFGKLRPYLRKFWKAEFDGTASSEFIIFKDSILDLEFLYWAIQSDSFVNDVNSSTYGSKMPRASWEYIKEIKIPFPVSQNEQKSIVKFLNERVVQINQMIAIKKEQIENINKQRQTLIYDYVTGKRRV